MAAATATQEAAAMRRTSVWWDIENCASPSWVNPIEISQNISLALHSVDIVGPVSISAYGDMLNCSRKLQNALTDTGVALNHIPSGKKETSDKAILVNMAFWAQDNPPPANIVLITGDSDFSTMLHRLRMRGFNIILVRPEGQVSESLLKAASLVWFWGRLVKGEMKELSVPRSTTQLDEPNLKPLVLTQERNARHDPIASALDKLKLENVLPTEAYIRHCLRYWQKPGLHMDLQPKLDKGVRLGRLQSSQAQGQVVYFPQGVALWECIDFEKGRSYEPAIWHELDVFLSGPRARYFVKSLSWFEAALVVKQYASDPVSRMTLGHILDLICQAIGKSWIRVDPVEWSPVIVANSSLGSSQPEQQVPNASLLLGERTTRCRLRKRKRKLFSAAGLGEVRKRRRCSLSAKKPKEADVGEWYDQREGADEGRQEAELEDRGEEAGSTRKRRRCSLSAKKPKEADVGECYDQREEVGSARKRRSSATKERRRKSLSAKKPKAPNDGRQEAELVDAGSLLAKKPKEADVGEAGSARKRRSLRRRKSLSKEPDDGREAAELEDRGEEAGLEDQSSHEAAEGQEECTDVLVQHCKELVKEKLNSPGGEKGYTLSGLKTDFVQRFGYELDHSAHGYSKLSQFIKAHLCVFLRQEDGRSYLVAS